MANPTLPTLTEGGATGIQATADDGLGLPYTRHRHDPGDTPPVETVMTQWQRMVATLLGGGPMGSSTNTPGPCQGQVFKHATALTCGALSCKYTHGGTDYAFAGGTLLLAASTTNYIYLDAAATLKTNTTAFPAGVLRLAKVTAGPSSITAIEDRRMQNFDPSGTMSWYSVAAAGDVDMAGFDLKDIGQMDFGASATLVIATGAITPTQVYHGVDTEAAAATDDLFTITADAAKVGQILILFNPGGSARVVTIQSSTGNIELAEGQDFVMDDPNNRSFITLIQSTATTWVELSRNEALTPTIVKGNIDVDGFRLVDAGAIAWRSVAVTIAAGVVDVSPSLAASAGSIAITNEAGSTDDLDTIVGGSGGQLLFVKPANAQTDSLVVKHNAVANGVLLNDAADFTMDDAGDYLLLFFDGSNWHEMARSKFRYEDLASGHTRLSIQNFISGALTAGVQKWAWMPHHSGKFNKFTCYVKTVPPTVATIVNINKNGSAIYASDTQAVNIPALSSSATSNQTNPVMTFVAGDRIEIDVKQTGGAADMTFTLDAEMTIK